MFAAINKNAYLRIYLNISVIEMSWNLWLSAYLHMDSKQCVKGVWQLSQISNWLLWIQNAIPSLRILHVMLFPRVMLYCQLASYFKECLNYRRINIGICNWHMRLISTVLVNCIIYCIMYYVLWDSQSFGRCEYHCVLGGYSISVGRPVCYFSYHICYESYYERDTLLLQPLA
jgi:hypothetical protein